MEKGGMNHYGHKLNVYICDQSTLVICFIRNYEHIVKAHQNNPQQGEDQVSDQIKFNIFQSIMDSLFQSFSNSVSVNSFQELSACVFSWIEEHCKPQVRIIILHTAARTVMLGRRVVFL